MFKVLATTLVHGLSIVALVAILNPKLDGNDFCMPKLLNKLEDFFLKLIYFILYYQACLFENGCTSVV